MVFRKLFVIGMLVKPWKGYEKGFDRSGGGRGKRHGMRKTEVRNMERETRNGERTGYILHMFPVYSFSTFNNSTHCYIEIPG